MDHNNVNMSLDDIIKQNKSKSNRGRGSFGTRAGRRGGGGRGRARGRGISGRGSANGGGQRSRSRSRSQSRNRLGVRGGGVAGRGRGRGARRGRGGRAGTAMGRLSRRDMNALGGPRARSRSGSRNNPVGNNQRSRSQSRGRDRSQSRRGRSQSQRGNRGGQNNNTQRQRSRSRYRGRGNNANQRGGRGRGVAKINRNRLLVTGISTEALRAKKLINAISSVGLRSDHIVQPRKLNRLQNRGNTRNQINLIRTQTFTRSRSRSVPRNKSATSLTVSVANEFAARKKLNRKRKNSGANQVGYLDKASLQKLTQLLGGGAVHQSNRPGSVRSAGSNRSRKSNRSSRSNPSRKRGRGGKNFSLQNALNPQLQQQIAQIQGRSFSNGVSATPDVTQPGINFTPTPHLTTTSLSERFSKM